MTGGGTTKPILTYKNSIRLLIEIKGISWSKEAF